MRSFLILILLLNCSSNRLLVIFGDFEVQLDETSAVLSISTDGKYSFEVVKKISGDIIENEGLSIGDVKAINQKRIELIDARNKHHWFLNVLSEEVLSLENSITFGNYELKAADHFYCMNALYPNGKTKFSGGWCNGNKCGKWYYYDGNGKMIREENHD